MVLWAGKDTLGNTWEAVEHLTNCKEVFWDFETAHCTTVPWPQQASNSPFPALPTPPNGFSIEAAAPDGPTYLMGREILYWWQGEGWQLGLDAWVLAKAGF